MRVLVTFGTKRGGTEGIARALGDTLRQKGLDVVRCEAAKAPPPGGFDAVVIGGALYANRWHRDARRYVRRHERALQRVPSWFFSSGPLDDSAEREVIPPTAQVVALMEAVGAQGHRTFGVRLAQDAHGFPASAMAKKHAGDWRLLEPIHAYAAEIARALPAARPGVARPQPARSPARIVAHGLVGWLVSAVLLAILLQFATVGTALVLRALIASVIFLIVAGRYFRARGAREPIPTALSFVAIVAALDFGLLGGLAQQRWVPFGSVAGSALLLMLVFLATWATGIFVGSMAVPKEPHLPNAHA